MAEYSYADIMQKMNNTGPLDMGEILKVGESIPGIKDAAQRSAAVDKYIDLAKTKEYRYKCGGDIGTLSAISKGLVEKGHYQEASDFTAKAEDVMRTKREFIDRDFEKQTSGIYTSEPYDKMPIGENVKRTKDHMLVNIYNGIKDKPEFAALTDQVCSKMSPDMLEHLSPQEEGIKERASAYLEKTRDVLPFDEIKQQLGKQGHIPTEDMQKITQSIPRIEDGMQRSAAVDTLVECADKKDFHYSVGGEKGTLSLVSKGLAEKGHYQEAYNLVAKTEAIIDKKGAILSNSYYNKTAEMYGRQPYSYMGDQAKIKEYYKKATKDHMLGNIYKEIKDKPEFADLAGKISGEMSSEMKAHLSKQSKGIAARASDAMKKSNSQKTPSTPDNQKPTVPQKPER